MHFEENRLILDNGKIAEFDLNIAEVVEIDGCTIVRLRVDPPHHFNENIFAVSAQTGQKIWQVEPIPTIYSDSPYTDLALENGEVKACNWDGTNVIIDAKSGKILRSVQGK